MPRRHTVLIGALLVRALSATTKSVAAAPAGEDRQQVLGPPFVPGRGPTTAAWREEVITRANELEGLAVWIAGHVETNQPSDTAILAYVREHLSAVRRTAAGEDRGPDDKPLGVWKRLVSSWRGAAHERALSNLDAVEATLLRVAPASFVCGEMPGLQAHVNRFLPKADPRRERVDALAAKANAEELRPAERGAVVAALHAANSQRRRDLLRVRSFRNVIFIATALLVPVAIGLAIFGAAYPTAIPLCFYPEEKQKVVCPTEEVPVTREGATAGEEAAPALDIDPFINDGARPGDMLLVEVIGLIAAVLGSAIALRNLKGTSTPYSMGVALALLKVPLGALAAVLGLLLISGGFVPGLSALDSSAQILAWALAFGFSQQLVSRFIDQRADTLLENVGGRGAAGDRDKNPS
jgi:hypothetical protein